MARIFVNFLDRNCLKYINNHRLVKSTESDSVFNYFKNGTEGDSRIRRFYSLELQTARRVLNTSKKKKKKKTNLVTMTSLAI